jgi:hypothetical protein
LSLLVERDASLVELAALEGAVGLARTGDGVNGSEASYSREDRMGGIEPAAIQSKEEARSVVKSSTHECGKQKEQGTHLAESTK